MHLIDTSDAPVAEEATDIVLSYLKVSDDEWTTETVPPRIRAVILRVVKNMHDELDDPLSDEVKDRLLGDRDPALA